MTFHIPKRRPLISVSSPDARTSSSLPTCFTAVDREFTAGRTISDGTVRVSRAQSQGSDALPTITLTIDDITHNTRMQLNSKELAELSLLKQETEGGRLYTPVTGSLCRDTADPVILFVPHSTADPTNGDPSSIVWQSVQPNEDNHTFKLQGMTPSQQQESRAQNAHSLASLSQSPIEAGSYVHLTNATMLLPEEGHREQDRISCFYLHDSWIPPESREGDNNPPSIYRGAFSWSESIEPSPTTIAGPKRGLVHFSTGRQSPLFACGRPRPRPFP
ncbi:hypothetical protein I316_02263 [Kwoniella heveanensis BCC8398]|uniref:Uncharacterized protein n=1 Tax=Kwoniella heveanensis BCC8398 TaxID=1296120 RepID=A0A1B9GXL0_9TREE|nr:hypothetical protein I316_02263 [Kwoniella heveanensis BCC8398]